MQIKDYLQYYWLEQEYLEKIRLSFYEKKYLTAEEFFSIVEWKNPKFGKTKLSHLTTKEIENLSRNVYEASPSKEKRLEIMLKDEKGNKRKGIKLATASAILTILFPTEFTVYDVRVRSKWILISPEDGKTMYPDITDNNQVAEIYFSDYLPKIKNFAEINKMSLRDCDRALWAKSWHDDLTRFLDKNK